MAIEINTQLKAQHNLCLVECLFPLLTKIKKGRLHITEKKPIVLNKIVKVVIVVVVVVRVPG